MTTVLVFLLWKEVTTDSDAHDDHADIQSATATPYQSEFARRQMLQHACIISWRHSLGRNSWAPTNVPCSEFWKFLWKINPVDYYFSSFSLFFLLLKNQSLEFRYIHTSDEMKTSFLLTKAAFVNDALELSFQKRGGVGKKNTPS